MEQEIPNKIPICDADKPRQTDDVRFTHGMLTLITTGLSFQAGFRAPAATSAARSMATMDATALKQARISQPASLSG